jgi:hypothetical protein
LSIRVFDVNPARVAELQTHRWRSSTNSKCAIGIASVGQWVSLLAIVLDAPGSEHPIRFDLVGSEEVREREIGLF